VVVDFNWQNGKPSALKMTWYFFYFIKVPHIKSIWYRSGRLRFNTTTSAAQDVHKTTGDVKISGGVCMLVFQWSRNRLTRDEGGIECELFG
jgi:hypothetical protein